MHVSDWNSSSSLLLLLFFLQAIIRFVHQLMPILVHTFPVVRLVQMVYILIVYAIVECIFVVHLNEVRNRIHVLKIRFHLANDLVWKNNVVYQLKMLNVPMMHKNHLFELFGKDKLILSFSFSFSFSSQSDLLINVEDVCRLET